jgi:hypothetical protein
LKAGWQSALIYLASAADQFDQFLDERAARRWRAGRKGREAIFKEFLQWQASRSIRR